MESIKDLPFEKAVTELESVVGKLEGDGLSLDETVALYERGRALAAHCQQLLDDVSLRVQQLSVGAEGEATVVPFPTETSA
ncbi:MAG: exodeoxyribonuclease VII small subunit [Anaerolineae bacterium]|nr:exodeoxyribonuclease VII small subunit [Anaerolineae bacterium]